MSAQLWSFHELPKIGTFDIRAGGEYVMTVRGTDKQTLQSLVDFWNDAERTHRMAMAGLPSLPDDELVANQVTRITEHTSMTSASAHAVVLGMLCSIQALLELGEPLVVTGALAASVDALIQGYQQVAKEETPRA